MTNVLYIHGFQSHFRPDSEKMRHLASKFDLFGVNLDYSKGFEVVKSSIKESIIKYKIDILVGTSMGGYMAQRLGNEFGLPWVAINPVVNPNYVLKDRIPDNMLDSYLPDATFEGAGLVLMDADDKIFNSYKTVEFIPETCGIEIYLGGDHQFQHMEEGVNEIERHYSTVVGSYE